MVWRRHSDCLHGQCLVCLVGVARESETVVAIFRSALEAIASSCCAINSLSSRASANFGLAHEAALLCFTRWGLTGDRMWTQRRPFARSQSLGWCHLTLSFSMASARVVAFASLFERLAEEVAQAMRSTSCSGCHTAGQHDFPWMHVEW